MSEETHSMERASRRTVLRAAGLGAGASVLAATSLAAASSQASGLSAPVGSLDVGADVAGPLVAYVSDVNSGMISLMFEGREVAVSDLALARALASKVR